MIASEYKSYVYCFRARRAAKEAKEAPAQPAPVSTLVMF